MLPILAQFLTLDVSLLIFAKLIQHHAKLSRTQAIRSKRGKAGILRMKLSFIILALFIAFPYGHPRVAPCERAVQKLMLSYVHQDALGFSAYLCQTFFSKSACTSSELAKGLWKYYDWKVDSCVNTREAKK